MEEKVQFEAEQLICCDCGELFIFSAGEKAFFWSKRLSEPKRCLECRRFRRQTLIRDQEGADG